MDYQFDFQQENLQQEKLVDYLLDFQQDSKSCLVSNRNSSFIPVRYIHSCWFLLVPVEIQRVPVEIQQDPVDISTGTNRNFLLGSALSELTHPS